MWEQAATEAAKSTSRIFLDGSAIMAIIAAGSLAAREYFKSKRSKRNGGNGTKPGLAPTCLEHQEKLTQLDERQANTKEDITELKSDVKELLRRVPPPRG